MNVEQGVGQSLEGQAEVGGEPGLLYFISFLQLPELKALESLAEFA